MKTLRACLGLALLVAGCAGEDAYGGPGPVGLAASECVDQDGDGFGGGCEAGRDCDDTDPSRHEGCLHCAQPSTGCECDLGSLPEPCFLDKTEDPDGVIMCHEGTRYCRDGSWSSCEGVHSYALPADRQQTALINPDSGPVPCSDCDVRCFRISDKLDPVDGGLGDDNSANLDWVAGGGLSLALNPDAGVGFDVDAAIPDIPDCVLGQAPDLDCDGIPDSFDPYPMQKPFATANPAIFLDIPAGETGIGLIDLGFFISAADIYFFVDQSGSMGEERDQLKADLVGKDFTAELAGKECADTDFDGEPNNELKAQGIVGAINCIIRDSQFGVGLFREIPFGIYADNDHVAFDNAVDITGNIKDVFDGIGALETIYNKEWPEAGAVALHNLVTGDGMYFGIERKGIPPRTDCSGSNFGYPCFRDGAIPVVILFTDAQFHNGPDNNDYAYDPNELTSVVGTTKAYMPVDNINEAFASADSLGDLTDELLTFSGSTAAMSADIPDNFVSCDDDGTGPDAVYQFSISQARDVTLSTQGSRFDTVVSLYRGVPTLPTALPDSNNMNEAAASAQDLGDLLGKSVTIDGTTSGMSADYDWSAIECSGATASADALYKFRMTQAGRVAIDTIGSTMDTVIGLYNAAPGAPPSYTASSNLNDELETDQAMGEVNNATLGYSGSTAASGITSGFTNTGCNADDDADDAVYSFTVGQTTRVRVSSEGSEYDTVLALVGQACPTPGTCSFIGADQLSMSNTNETQASAYDLGTMNDAIYMVSGSTWSMSDDYDSVDLGCGADDAARDAVWSFSLADTTTVSIDTSGTGWDTVVSLFGDKVTNDTFVDNSANINEALDDNPFNLGAVNSKSIVVTGADTGSMDDDYNQPFAVCTAHNTGADAAYRFSLTSDTRVKIDVSSAAFTPALSLYGEGVSTNEVAMAPNDDEAAADLNQIGDITQTTQIITGSTGSTSDTYDEDCGSSGEDSKDAVFTFTVSDTSEYVFSTEGSGFDATLALYPASIDEGTPGSAPTPTKESSGDTNDDWPTLHDVGDMDDAYTIVSGNSWNNGTNQYYTSCGAYNWARDAFFSFRLDEGTNFQIDTAGSTWDTVIAVALPGLELECDADSGADGYTSIIQRYLDPGTYYVWLKGDSWTGGDYVISFQDLDAGVAAVPGNLVECDDDGGAGDDAEITRTLDPGTYHLVVKGDTAGAAGNYKVLFRDNTWHSGLGGYIACDAGSPSTIERDLSAGDYWMLVKGYWWSSNGAYDLSIQDVTNPPSGAGPIACDDNTNGDGTSRIERTLAPGDYHIALSGDASGDRGSYSMTVKDETADAIGAVIACDDDGGDGNTSVIERDLDPGTYHVIVKGDASTDEGKYQLQVRDVTSNGHNRLACDQDSGGNDDSYLEYDLSAGDYYVMVKGDQDTAEGSYSLSIRDTDVPTGDAACNDDGGLDGSSYLSVNLGPGTYYAAVKGYDGADSGDYLFTVGGGTPTKERYVPPTWSETLAALNARDVHVMTVLSCQDDPDHGDGGDCDATRAQATSLANGTDTLGANLSPLVLDINRDGSGLGSSVVDGVAELANYLEMDVKVQIVFEPDANPGFILNVEAIDQASDGCSGLVGIEHQSCVPGASPRFVISLENPLGAPVPLNPSDPLGGYNFRAELIGDDQFVVDQVPIYVIPEDIIPNPPVGEIFETGQYWQDSGSSGCVNANDRPNWKDLSWDANVYTNTRVTFSACTAESAEALDSCIPSDIATVTGGEACTSDADCTVGWCDADVGNCQIAKVGTCADDTQCPAAATCEMNECVFRGQPVYIGGVLGSGNFKTFLRMYIDMGVTEPYPAAPVLYGWEMTYTCNTVE